MFAIISDIHSNIEALTTVLADIENRGIKTIYCLGDVIGYGANPRECLDLVLNRPNGVSWATTITPRFMSLQISTTAQNRPASGHVSTSKANQISRLRTNDGNS